MQNNQWGIIEDELPSRSPIQLRDNTNASNPDTHKIGIPAVQPQYTSSPDPKKIRNFDAAGKHMVKPSGYRKRNKIPELLGFTPTMSSLQKHRLQ